MSSSASELDRFLDDLSVRRQRLLGLATTAGAEEATLLDELTQLSEQLIVADEELRVQQEELESTQDRLAVLTADRDQLLLTSTQAMVVTDEDGTVVSSNREAIQLVRQPAARVSPRPIATWFDVPDRARVRALIGKRHEAGPQQLDRALLRCPDRTTVPVRVTMQPSIAPSGHGWLLRWELTPLEQLRPRLRVVRPEEPVDGAPEEGAAEQPVDDPTFDHELLVGLTAMATRLAATGLEQDLPAVIVAEAVALVPGAEHAAVALRRRGGQLEPTAWSSTETRATCAAQCAGTTPPPAGALAVEFVRPRGAIGTLWVYAPGAGAFDDEAALVAGTVAVLAALAIDRASTESGLREAITSRQLIGEAIGILMERGKVTSEAAFAALSRQSQNVNIKVRDLAQIVVETGQDPAEITRR